MDLLEQIKGICTKHADETIKKLEVDRKTKDLVSKLAERDTRIADLEAELEVFAHDDARLTRVLLDGGNYDKCSRCGELLPNTELHRKTYSSGDDLETEYLCECCI